jgi:hypothetical protein
MKYLKTYKKLNESSSDIIETIEDILLEIRDNGIDIDISPSITYYLTDRKSHSQSARNGVGIYIHTTPGEIFHYDQIKDTLHRLNEYAKSIGCGMHIDPSANAMEFVTLKEYEQDYSMGEIVQIDVIIYDKKPLNSKHVNEFFDFFKKKRELTPESSSEIESKAEELSYLLYDIFDEYDIIDGNDEVSELESRPRYFFWRYGKHGRREENPKDSIVISFKTDKTEPSDVKKLDDMLNKIDDAQEQLEKQLGHEIRIDKYSREYPKRNGQSTGGFLNVVISIKHDLKLHQPYRMSDAGPG